MCLNACFQFLNNITCIFTHFFTHVNFQKNWKMLFKYTYQTSPKYLIDGLVIDLLIFDWFKIFQT